eukprot:533939-Prorocentrum_minimum.AAC.1
MRRSEGARVRSGAKVRGCKSGAHRAVSQHAVSQHAVSQHAVFQHAVSQHAVSQHAVSQHAVFRLVGLDDTGVKPLLSHSTAGEFNPPRLF